MFTCCPHCKTCFRITRPQLEIAQGKVRCGKCKQIFNGKQHLSDDIQKSGKPTGQSENKPAKATAKPVPPAKPEIQPTAKPAPRAEAPAEPTTAKPVASDNQFSASKRSLDLDLFSSHEFSGSFEDEDEDDSWLDNLDEEESEEHDEEYEDEEGDEDEDVIEETEIIEMDDSHSDIFASLEKIIPVDLLTNTEQPEQDEEGFFDDEVTRDEILQSEVDSAIKAMQQKNAQTDAVDSVFDYLPEEEQVLEETQSQTESGSLEGGESKAEVDQTPSAYEYFDPDELLDEEKNIEQILDDMNSQLKQALPDDDGQRLISTPGADDENEETDEPSIFFKPNEWELSLEEKDTEPKHAQPMASKESKKDSFESEFLASLDSTLAEAADTATAPPEPAPSSASKSKKISYEDEEDPFLGFDTGAPSVPAPVNDLPGAKSDEADLPYRLREDFSKPVKERGIGYYLGAVVAIVLLMAGLLLQLVVFRSNDVVENYLALEPMMTRLCKQLPCRYTSRTDVSRIKLLSRDIRVHPTAKNALLITATMVNRAGFPQPYPDIRITLADLGGEVVARRRFGPREYLGREPSPFLRMPVGKPVKIALEVIDPGKDAVNFEFTFHDKFR